MEWMMRARGGAAAVLAATVVAHAAAAHPQAAPPRAPDTVVVTPGARYAKH